MADNLLFDIDIDLSKNQLLNARFHNLNTPPTVLSGDTGLHYWNTNTKTLNIWDGDTWVSGGSGSGTTINLSGTTNRISIGGTQSNPIIDISANYIGQTSITTLGTITGGTWNGLPIADNYISGASIWNNHVNNASIHFVQSAITITESQVTNLVNDLQNRSLTGHTHNQYTLESDLTSHTGDTAIHFKQSDIIQVGIITGGTWNGNPIADNYISGASIWNSHVNDNTIHFAQSGITITESQVTNLVSDLASKSNTGHTHSQYTLDSNFISHTGDTSIHFTQGAITTVGTITGGTWQGTIISSQFGGTGINNSGNTLTILNNSIISGNNTGDQNITISGDVVTSAMVNGTYIATLPDITTAGTYNNIIVNSKGQVTSGNTAANTNNTITFVSDTTPTGTTNTGDFWYQPSGALLYVYVNNSWVITDATLIGDGLLTITTNGIGITGSTTFSANQTSGSTIVITSNATPNNTPLTIVSRDTDGNFTANTITVTNLNINNSNLLYQENLSVNSGTTIISQLFISGCSAVFYDYTVKNGINVRAGSISATHDGTNVVFTEYCTTDLGNTNDVVLSIDINGEYIRLVATVASNSWTIKSIIRTIK